MRMLATGAAAGAALWAWRHQTSASVAAWAPPSLAGDQTATLYARSGGDGDTAIVLLHGLVSSGDVFGNGYNQLAKSHRLVVPDLLGFGRSIDESRDSFSVDDHLDALDELAAQTGLFERQWVVGAHSMGTAVALRWAARHPNHVERVVCWGAPIYASPEAARGRISGSAMARLFVLDTRWAERACAISCRHRAAAGWATAALEPSLPIPVARAMPLHTWPAYRDAMRHLVIETDWQGLLVELDDLGIRVNLTWGSDDKVGDHTHARAISAAGSNSTVSLIPGADHHLPMSHPDVCISQLTDGVGDPAGP